MGFPHESTDPNDLTGAAFAALWTMPLTVMRMMHDVQIEMMHGWARQCLQAPHHRHEPASQLEVPDPLEEDDEHDLFA